MMYNLEKTDIKLSDKSKDEIMSKNLEKSGFIKLQL